MGTAIVFRGDTTERVSDWQVPPFESSPQERKAWVDEQILEAEGYAENQPAFKNLAKNIQIYNGVFRDEKTKSTLVSNFVKYNVRKFVTTLSETREIGTYGSDAKQYKGYTEIVNKVAKCVYLESQFVRQTRKALQYAAVMGVGYIWPKCIRDDYGYGERKIYFEPLGPLDVLAVQVPKSNDIEDAYCVIIYEYVPIAEAHGKYPLFQSLLKPVSACDIKSRLQARRLDFQEQVRFADTSRNWGNLYCEFRHAFVRDLRINRTGKELPMGDLDTSWFYKVPTVGQEIPDGIKNGQLATRQATPEDCRVYPQLRLITTAAGVETPLYDGPAYDWYGKMPPVQYTVDDVPWEPGGRSLVEDVATIEQTKRKHERKMDAVLTVRLNPPMGYDMDATGGPKIENFDIFEQDVRMGVSGEPTKQLQSLLPDTVQVTEPNFKFWEMLKTMETEQLGITDLGNIANMKLNMNEGALEKALESVGPIAKDIAASLEASNAKVAYRLKFLIMQYFDTARIIQYIGPDGILPEVYDFDPTSMVPSHMPDELVNGSFPELPSVYDKIKRAKYFAKNLRLTSVPNTLVRITQLQEQLKYLQLYRGGFPISPHTVAKKLDIANFGEIAGSTEFEKWVNWKKLELFLQLAMAQMVGGVGGIGGQGGGEGGKPHAGGRPPSGQKAPKIKQKGGPSGPRTTVSESG